MKGANNIIDIDHIYSKILEKVNESIIDISKIKYPHIND